MPIPKTPKELKVVNLLPGIDGATMAHRVTWRPMSGVSSYNVYRSLVPYGTFSLLSSAQADGITDLSLSYIIDADPHYRVSAVNYLGEGPLTEPVTHEDTRAYNAPSPLTDRVRTGSAPKFLPGTNPLPTDIIRLYQFNTIRRRLLWQLEDIGEEVWLFKRRQPDPDVPEDGREYGRNADYFPPIKIRARMVSAAETKVPLEYGLRRERAPRSWTIWTPFLNNLDIIVDRQNRKYELMNVTKHYARGILITHQDFDMIELQKNGDEYKNAQLLPPGAL